MSRLSNDLLVEIFKFTLTKDTYSVCVLWKAINDSLYPFLEWEPEWSQPEKSIELPKHVGLQTCSQPFIELVDSLDGQNNKLYIEIYHGYNLQCAWQLLIKDWQCVDANSFPPCST